MEELRLRIAKASIAGVLIIALAAPLVHASPLQEPQEPQQQPAPATPQPSQPAPDANPPGAPQNAPETPSPQLVDPATRPSSTQGDQQQNSHPVGTAVAPVVKPTGVAASRPAGAVIAPAKQRRMRTIVIRVAIIVAAGVAVGTVAALSRSSSPRP